MAPGSRCSPSIRRIWAPTCCAGNGATGPGFFNLDARVSYSVPLGPRRLEVFGDLFNVTNRANFASPTADVSNTGTFLLLRAYSTSYAPRKIQLGARFVF